MTSRGPSKLAEALVAVFLPPACREETLGDLYERFTSPPRYLWDALRTVPLVIFSRMRRIVDLQIVVIQFVAWYLSVFSDVWLTHRALLGERSGLWRFAIPAAVAVVCLILDDTYAKPGRGPLAQRFLGPALGAAVALICCRTTLREWGGDLGPGVLGFLLSSGIRMWFPPITNQPQAANAPTDLVKQESAVTFADFRTFQRALAVATGVFIIAWMIARAAPPSRVVPALVALVAVYAAAGRIDGKG
jgi:hypothetical protein